MTDEAAVLSDSTPEPISTPMPTPDEMADYRANRRASITEASKPQAKEKIEPEEKVVPSGDVKTPSEAAAASEAAKPQEAKPKRSDAAKRIQELLEENNRLRATQLKSDVTRQSSPAKTEEAPKLRAEPKQEDKDASGQPKYKTWDEWLADVRKWDREAVKFEFQQESAEQQKKAEVAKQTQTHAEKWKGQVEEARKAFSDYDQVAFRQEIADAIPNNSVIDIYIRTRADGAKMLYHLGQHPEKIAEMLKLDPFDQSDALLKISREMKPAEVKPPAKKISQAPATPIDVGGTGGPVPDEVEQATKEGDMSAYRHARRARVLSGMGR